MALAGADLVFGVQLLKTLGPVVTDYTSLTLQFHKGGNLVTLQGQSAHCPSEISHRQVKRLISTNRASVFYHIQMSPIQTPSLSSSPLHPQLQTLLSQFSELFEQLDSLPPPRPTDHPIHLTPNQPPVNVHPYRDPYFQKQEIENQVDDMLQRGMIQPSRSTFSSPVLLVKKKMAHGASVLITEL